MTFNLISTVLFSVMTIFFLLLSLNTGQAEGRILRRSCGDYANFTYIVADSVLQGHRITSLPVSSEEQCESSCIDAPSCKSINVENVNGNRLCELNGRSAADASDAVELVPKNGWTFKSTSYQERLLGPLCNKLDPCEIDHLCMDVCYSPGYKCTHCKELANSKPCVRAITNIARGKPAKQSSTLSTYAAWKGVDGQRHGVYPDSFPCMHSKNEKNPWWGVNFRGTAVVFSLAIFARKDYPLLLSRLEGLLVKLGDTFEPNKNLLIWTIPTIPSTLTQRKNFTNPKRGKYLFVESNKDDVYIDFCEMEVEGYLE